MEVNQGVRLDQINFSVIKIILTLSVLMVFGHWENAKGQQPDEMIEMRQGLTMRYFQAGKKLNQRELFRVLSTNPVSEQKIKKIRLFRALDISLGLAGGLLIGIPLGVAIAGGNPNWILAGAGAGLGIASIPFSVLANRRTKDAVKIYNEGLSHSYLIQPDHNSQLVSQAISIRYRF